MEQAPFLKAFLEQKHEFWMKNEKTFFLLQKNLSSFFFQKYFLENSVFDKKKGFGIIDTKSKGIFLLFAFTKFAKKNSYQEDPVKHIKLHKG